MKRKKLFLLFGSISLALMLVALPFIGGCAPPPEEEVVIPPEEEVTEPIVLKAVSAWPVGDDANEPLVMFMDKVNERAKGELIIEYVGGPEVMSEFVQYEAVAAGRMDMAINDPTYAPGVIPGAAAHMISGLTGAELRASGAYDYFNEIHKTANVFLLAKPVEPGFMLWLNTRVERVEDLAGLKLGDGTIMPHGLAALGAIPTTVGFMEIYSALERGVIDGVAIPPPVVGFMHLYEVVKYVIGNVDCGFATTALIINLDKFNGLPQHLQELLKEAAIEAELESEASKLEAYPVYMKEITDAGVEVIDFSPEDVERFHETLYGAEWDAIIERHPDIGPKLKELFSK